MRASILILMSTVNTYMHYCCTLQYVNMIDVRLRISDSVCKDLYCNGIYNCVQFT